MRRIRKRSAVCLALLLALLVACLTGCSSDELAEAAEALTFQEVSYADGGLLAAPTDGTTEELDAEGMTQLFGEGLVAQLDETLSSLSRSTNSQTVAYNADGTLCYGAELGYWSEEDSNQYVLVSMNPDHAVKLGYYYYADEDPYLDDSTSDDYMQFSAAVPDILTPNNTVEDVSVWLGHTVQYGGDEEGNKVELDVYVASFEANGVNYVVETIGQSKELLLEAVSVILTQSAT